MGENKLFLANPIAILKSKGDYKIHILQINNSKSTDEIRYELSRLTKRTFDNEETIVLVSDDFEEVMSFIHKMYGVDRRMYNKLLNELGNLSLRVSNKSFAEEMEDKFTPEEMKDFFELVTRDMLLQILNQVDAGIDNVLDDNTVDLKESQEEPEPEPEEETEDDDYLADLKELLSQDEDDEEETLEEYEDLGLGSDSSVLAYLTNEELDDYLEHLNAIIKLHVAGHRRQKQ